MIYNILNILSGLVVFQFKGEQFEYVASIILRLPGYLYLDYWYQYQMIDTMPESGDWQNIISSAVSLFGWANCMLVIFLPFEQLVTLYMHYLAAVVMVASKVYSYYYIETERLKSLENPDYASFSLKGFSNMFKKPSNTDNDLEIFYIRHHVMAVIFHILAASLIVFFLDRKGKKDQTLLLVYLIPVLARIVGVPVIDLQIAHKFSYLFSIFLVFEYIFLSIPQLFRFFKDLFLTLWVINEIEGSIGVITVFFAKLFTPIYLFLLWVILFLFQIYNNLVSNADFLNNVKQFNEYYLPIDYDEMKYSKYILMLLYCEAEICYTPLMLAGTSVAIAYAARFVLMMLRLFTAGSANMNDDLEESGVREGVTMALLSIQTSLMERSVTERCAMFSIILLIVFSSLLQEMFDIVESMVMSLSAQGLTRISRHIKAVFLCTILLVLPLYMVYIFLLIFEKDYWLLCIVSTNIITFVKVLGLIITYTFLTIDSYSNEPWSCLDDIVYYTRASSCVFEFLVAVFVFGSGVKEAILGHWSWISAGVLFIHCYFNVWQRLQQGWYSFLLRINAAKKITSLPEATPDEIIEYNDVCSICFSKLSTAVITPCRHFFHSPCLKKWLYVHDKCPMCQSSISIQEQEEPSIEEELGNNIPFPEEEELEIINVNEDFELENISEEPLEKNKVIYLLNSVANNNNIDSEDGDS